jgi:membrane associated rhomboid family serine protease
MIIPIGHESMGYRRWPYVTLAVVLTCVVTHGIVAPIEAEHLKTARQTLEEAKLYHARHPYLETKPPLDKLIGWGNRGRAVVRHPEQAPDSAEDRLREQAFFDELGSTYSKAIDGRPKNRYGYVPIRHDIWQLVTYQFLHGDWLHLLSNMWFLWLCGVNMEDRWGRSVFVPFYLVAGIFAALTEAFFGGASTVPLIGASGAIAGAMGAFLVTQAYTRIRFVAFLAYRPVVFTARTYLMLPLWFASELFYFYFAKPGYVAHGAHVGGFIFGAAVAFVLKQTGVDKKLDSAIEEKIAVKQDPRIVEASEWVNQGQPEKALELLEQVYAESPANIDVQLEMLRATKAANLPEREIAAYGRLLQLYLREKQSEPATNLFRELRAEKRHEKLPVPALLAIAQSLESAGHERDSAQAYEAIHHGNPANLVEVKAVIAQAKIEARLGAVDYARELLTIAKESPFSTKELDDAAEEELKKLT